MITAKLRHLKISPRKVRLVADLIRGLKVGEAENQLRFLPKRSAEPVLKLLNSAIANAKHNFGLDKDLLFISQIKVDCGPSLKRWRPRAMGRTSRILKRTSHVSLVLASSKPLGIKKRIAKEKQKPTSISLEKKETVEEAPRIERENKNPESIPPKRPYGSTPSAKKRFFSRQTFGNAKKMFRRKSF